MNFYLTINKKSQLKTGNILTMKFSEANIGLFGFTTPINDHHLIAVKTLHETLFVNELLLNYISAEPKFIEGRA